MNRNEWNRQNTITDIKESFIALYEEYGIDKLSVREICEAAHISRTIFYKYFDDKYQVLEEIEEELLAETHIRNAELNREPVKQYARGYSFRTLEDTISYIYEKKKYFKPLLGPNGDTRFQFRWQKQIREDVKGSIYDPNASLLQFSDLNVVYDLFASICIGLYTYWFYENPELTVEQVVKLLSYLIYTLFVAR